jgi:hypothetical protein
MVCSCILFGALVFGYSEIYGFILVPCYCGFHFIIKVRVIVVRDLFFRCLVLSFLSALNCQQLSAFKER